MFQSSMMILCNTLRHLRTIEPVNGFDRRQKRVLRLRCKRRFGRNNQLPERLAD
jgi:hypothetical protein